MKTTVTAALLLVSLPAWADLQVAREAMKQQQPARAEEAITSLLRQTPDDLWLKYDAGVVAYAQKDYEKAEQIWQDLAAQPLPPKLQDKVWMQIGNVSFRKGEPLAAKTPEQALPQWEQSREALRVAVNSNKENKTAANNLAYVEGELARLHVKLARRLIQDVKKEWDSKRQIEKLQAALDHQLAAQNLQPKDEEIKKEAKQTEKLLAEKFNDKAKKEEKTADNIINKPTPNGWERKHAEEQLNNALADFQEAKSLDAENKEAQEGEKRVQEKLADLLTKNGEQLAQEARETQEKRPNDAIEKFEKALEKFEQAQNHQSEHQEAKAGEERVKKELEQLHLEQADKLAALGDKDAAKRPAQAAEEMMQALDHLQQAQGLNPENQEIPPKIDALEKKLPDLLMALGEREQQLADKAEPKSMHSAVQHLEKAATAYQMVQDLQKENQAAQQAEEKVQDRLSRLRNQIAQMAQAQPQQAKEKSEEEENNQTFQSLLAQFKNDEKQKQYEQQRNGQQQKYDPDKVRNYKNW